MEGHSHGDLGILPDGVTEIFMTTSGSSPMDQNRPAIVYYELPGTIPSSPPNYLLPIDWADIDHLSCQGPHGTALVSYGGWEGAWTPFELELFFIQTDGSVKRLVHHRSSGCGYWVQPRASASSDGRYILFASDWGTGNRPGTAAAMGTIWARVIPTSLTYSPT